MRIMKNTGTWSALAVLLAVLSHPVAAADADRELPELTQAEAAVDATGEALLPEPPYSTDEAGLCASSPGDAPAAAVNETCQDGQGCSTSVQCNGGQCFRHRCLC